MIKVGRGYPIDKYMPDVASCHSISQRHSFVE